MTRFDRKVVAVTGGGSGIGAAAAHRLAAEGARVVVNGRRREQLAAVAESLDGVAVVGDITDAGTADAIVAAAVDRFGALDVIVANAGVGFGGSVAAVSDDAWDRTLDVNLTGAMRLVRAAAPEMARRPGASVVLVSSVSGLVAAPSSAAYVAAKSALLGLTRAIAVDLAPRGIRANAVVPGWVRTEMGDAAMRDLIADDGLELDAAYDVVTSAVPMRRPAVPEEVAACIAFLASDDASYVTGAALAVDGGLLAVDVGALAFPQPSDHGRGDGPAR